MLTSINFKKSLYNNKNASLIKYSSSKSQ